MPLSPPVGLHDPGDHFSTCITEENILDFDDSTTKFYLTFIEIGETQRSHLNTCLTPYLIRSSLHSCACLHQSTLAAKATCF